MTKSSLSVRVSVKSLYLRNALRIPYQTICSDLRLYIPLFPEKKTYFYIYLEKKIWPLYSKNAYFDTIKGIKLNRVLPVNIEL